MKLDGIPSGMMKSLPTMAGIFTVQCIHIVYDARCYAGTLVPMFNELELCLTMLTQARGVVLTV